mgnify:FL=1
MTKRLFIDIHILQTVPPSCINRDDTGSPKTAVYGGVTRARVSSQAWKKAVRDMFRSNTINEQFEMGIRTKSLLKLVTEKIMEKNPDIDQKKASTQAMKTINLAGKDIIKTKMKDDDSEASGNEALFFITPKQIDSVAELALLWIKEDKIPKKDEVINALNINKGIDEALFGRMVAQAPTLNTEASAQVAHSISTHKVISEYDYFTAVDDVESDEHSGSAHIGTNEFYSATLYRYATIAVHELKEYLGAKTAEAVKGFVDAFVLSMPTGKKNSYANNNIPYTVFVTLRKDLPVNLSGAFEKAVTAGRDGTEGYEQASFKALEKHARNIYENWLGNPEEKFYCWPESEVFGERLNFADLKEKVYEQITEFSAGGDLV